MADRQLLGFRPISVWSLFSVTYEVWALRHEEFTNDLADANGVSGENEFGDSTRGNFRLREASIYDPAVQRARELEWEKGQKERKLERWQVIQQERLRRRNRMKKFKLQAVTETETEPVKDGSWEARAIAQPGRLPRDDAQAPHQASTFGSATALPAQRERNVARLQVGETEYINVSGSLREVGHLASAHGDSGGHGGKSDKTIAGDVIISQPPDADGHFRSWSWSACEVVALTGQHAGGEAGCFDVNDIECGPQKDLCLKRGENCFTGGITVPRGIRVTMFSTIGTETVGACQSQDRIVAEGAAHLTLSEIDVWKEGAKEMNLDQRACSFKFEALTGWNCGGDSTETPARVEASLASKSHTRELLHDIFNPRKSLIDFPVYPLENPASIKFVSGGEHGSSDDGNARREFSDKTDDGGAGVSDSNAKAFDSRAYATDGAALAERPIGDRRVKRKNVRRKIQSSMQDTDSVTNHTTPDASSDHASSEIRRPNHSSVAPPSIEFHNGPVITASEYVNGSFVENFHSFDPSSDDSDRTETTVDHSPDVSRHVGEIPPRTALESLGEHVEQASKISSIGNSVIDHTISHSRDTSIVDHAQPSSHQSLQNQSSRHQSLTATGTKLSANRTIQSQGSSFDRPVVKSKGIAMQPGVFLKDNGGVERFEAGNFQAGENLPPARIRAALAQNGEAEVEYDEEAPGSSPKAAPAYQSPMRLDVTGGMTTLEEDHRFQPSVGSHRAVAVLDTKDEASSASGSWGGGDDMFAKYRHSINDTNRVTGELTNKHTSEGASKLTSFDTFGHTDDSTVNHTVKIINHKGNHSVNHSLKASSNVSVVDANGDNVGGAEAGAEIVPHAAATAAAADKASSSKASFTSDEVQGIATNTDTKTHASSSVSEDSSILRVVSGSLARSSESDSDTSGTATEDSSGAGDESRRGSIDASSATDASSNATDHKACTGFASDDSINVSGDSSSLSDASSSLNFESSDTRDRSSSASVESTGASDAYGYNSDDTSGAADASTDDGGGDARNDGSGDYPSLAEQESEIEHTSKEGDGDAASGNARDSSADDGGSPPPGTAQSWDDNGLTTMQPAMYQAGGNFSSNIDSGSDDEGRGSAGLGESPVRKDSKMTPQHPHELRVGLTDVDSNLTVDSDGLSLTKSSLTRVDSGGARPRLVAAGRGVGMNGAPSWEPAGRKSSRGFTSDPHKTKADSSSLISEQKLNTSQGESVDEDEVIDLRWVSDDALPAYTDAAEREPEPERQGSYDEPDF
eukprot:TRINITY_DN11895_c0_g1_i1.p1 TRINITY_DN11895_c0_g1~~TRINITY_DN11895_c0_g1_i1.p1  ORF type:complete len:1263 (+),score=232.45 TRINITY_DN11895_c0_g1_i1:91-3879(+)